MPEEIDAVIFRKVDIIYNGRVLSTVPVEERNTEFVRLIEAGEVPADASVEFLFKI